jgi:hypothetical protein
LTEVASSLNRAVNGAVAKALEAAGLHGLLMKSDPKLPSVTTLVAGEPIRGSWWGHPKGRQIFRVLAILEDREEVTTVKLISGKDTFVHKRLFPALLSIGTARDDWQLDGLSGAARHLLELVDKEGIIKTEQLRLPGAGTAKVGGAARELEAGLLVRGDNVHTSSGKHAKCLESWNRWAERAGVGNRPDPRDAKQEFGRILQSLNDTFQAKARLPWPATPG